MRGTVHVVSTRDYALFGAALDVAAARLAHARRRGDRPPGGTVVARVHCRAAHARRDLRLARARARDRLRRHQPRLVCDADPRPDRPLGRGQPLACSDPRPDLRRGRARRATTERSRGRSSCAATSPRSGLPPAPRSPAGRASRCATSRDLLEGLAVLRDDRGRELLDLPRAPRPAADTPAPVRFLPKFDNVLLDRARVLPEAYRRLVVRKNADVQPTFTVDGYVAGVWRVEKQRVVVEPFAPFPRTARRELEDERSPAGSLARVASPACSSAATARAGSRRRSTTRTRSAWTRCSCSPRAHAPGASRSTIRPTSRRSAPGARSSGSARSRSTPST